MGVVYLSLRFGFEVGKYDIKSPRECAGSATVTVALITRLAIQLLAKYITISCRV